MVNYALIPTGFSCLHQGGISNTKQTDDFEIYFIYHDSK